MLCYLYPVALEFQSSGATSSLPPIYMLLANIQIARARDAPKVLLPDARESFHHVTIVDGV